MKAVLTYVSTFRHVYWEIFIELQRIAREFAERKEVNHNFKHEIKLAGKD
jgi:hypothetical protein